jgi:hypothetical protein
VPRPWRPALAGLAALLLVGLTGCTDDAAPPPRPGQDLRLDASVAQFRFDEGTRNLKAGVGNRGEGDIRVTRATIDWPGMVFPTLDLPDTPVRPGQTAAFTIAYARARCGAEPSTRPVLRAVVDGRERSLPLRVEDPGLLVRLRDKACAAQALDAVASVRLLVSRHTERLGGEEYLPGTLVVRRRGPAGERVRVVDLTGSVLVDVLPRGGRRALPEELGPDDRALSFPLLFGSAHRCDAHAVSQSSQTFLLSAYLRRGDGPPQRVLLPLSAPERDRLTGLLRRECR